MARALVLGATGHIGAHIVRALLAEGHTVRAAYRRKQYLHVLDNLPVERCRVDVESLEGLPQALEGCAWVFHAAGYYPLLRGRREQAVARGVESTRPLLAALEAARPQRIVFTSSASTIRRVPGRAATEADQESWPPDGWRPLYASVKIAMEREALDAAQRGVPLVIVNPSVCLGEYDAHPFSGRLILAFANYRLPWYLETSVNGVYTGDVAVGHVRAAERGRVGERYLLTGRNLTIREFAALVCREAGLPPPRWRVSQRAALAAALASEAAAWLTRTEPLLPRQVIRGAQPGQQLDGSKALHELSLPQTPVEEAIRRAIEWFRRQGMLQ